MPPHDGSRLHDHQGEAPLPPCLGEQDSKEAISVAKWGMRDGPPEHGQLLTERKVLERHRSVTAADQRQGPRHDEEGGQQCAILPCHRSRNQRAWPRSCCGEGQP
jgi:hypothetical protein